MGLMAQDSATQHEIDAKVQRLFNLVVKASKAKGVGPDAATDERDALALCELGSLFIGSIVRMADAQERIAAILEEEYGPPNLVRGK